MRRGTGEDVELKGQCENVRPDGHCGPVIGRPFCRPQEGDTTVEARRGGGRPSGWPSPCSPEGPFCPAHSVSSDTVSAQRQIISAKRKSLEEDIAKLTKWETHKAKLYREYQLSLAMRTEVEAVLMPLSRKIQKRQVSLMPSPSFTAGFPVPCGANRGISPAGGCVCVCNAQDMGTGPWDSSGTPAERSCVTSFGPIRVRSGPQATGECRVGLVGFSKGPFWNGSERNHVPLCHAVVCASEVWGLESEGGQREVVGQGLLSQGDLIPPLRPPVGLRAVCPCIGGF